MTDVFTSAERAIIRKSSLFEGLDDAEMDTALSLMNARQRLFARSEFVQRIGEPVRYACVVLSRLLVGSFNTAGYNEVNLGHFEAGDTFGVAFAAGSIPSSPVQAVAQNDTAVVQLELARIGTGAGAGDGVELKLARNLIRALVGQNLHLNRRVRVLGQDSIRNRVITFLAECPTDADGSVVVGFSQTELAKYLGVNRSALSRELSHMRAEGILEGEGKRLRMV